MPNLKTYNLFISHAWKYGDDYSHVVDLLNYAPYFYYRNYSAPQEKPLLIAGNDVRNAAEIRSAIIQKIKPVHCVLIISGMYYNNRQWMQFEIDTAKKLRKPIIAIKPWGASRMPIEVQSVADVIVGWNTSSIVDAIRQYSL